MALDTGSDRAPFFAFGTLAQQPPTGQTPRLYYALDTGALYLDTGAGWIALATSSAVPGASIHVDNAAYAIPDNSIRVVVQKADGADPTACDVTAPPAPADGQEVIVKWRAGASGKFIANAGQTVDGAANFAAVGGEAESFRYVAALTDWQVGA